MKKATACTFALTLALTAGYCLTVYAQKPVRERQTKTAAAQPAAEPPAPSTAPATATKPEQEEIKPLRVLEGHTDYVFSVAFSPDGKYLASGSSDETARLWKTADGSLAKIIEDHAWYVWSVAFSPDNKLLATASEDETARLWTLPAAEMAATLEGHKGRVHAVAFSPDSALVATASADGTVKLWKTADGRLVRTLAGHSGDVFCLAFSPDGKTLASGGADLTVRLWRADDGKQIRVLEGHTSDVLSLVFSPDGKNLVSTGGDSTIRLWRAQEGIPLKIVRDRAHLVFSSAFSPDGSLLATGSDDNTIKIWTLREMQGADNAQKLDISLHKTINGHDGWVRTVAFSRDGRMLASGSFDNTVKLWDVSDFKAGPLTLAATAASIANDSDNRLQLVLALLAFLCAMGLVIVRVTLWLKARHQAGKLPAATTLLNALEKLRAKFKKAPKTATATPSMEAALPEKTQDTMDQATGETRQEHAPDTAEPTPTTVNDIEPGFEIGKQDTPTPEPEPALEPATQEAQSTVTEKAEEPVPAAAIPVEKLPEPVQPLPVENAPQTPGTTGQAKPEKTETEQEKAPEMPELKKPPEMPAAAAIKPQQEPLAVNQQPAAGTLRSQEPVRQAQPMQVTPPPLPASTPAPVATAPNQTTPTLPVLRQEAVPSLPATQQLQQPKTQPVTAHTEQKNGFTIGQIVAQPVSGIPEHAHDHPVMPRPIPAPQPTIKTVPQQPTGRIGGPGETVRITAEALAHAMNAKRPAPPPPPPPPPFQTARMSPGIRAGNGPSAQPKPTELPSMRTVEISTAQVTNAVQQQEQAKMLLSSSAFLTAPAAKENPAPPSHPDRQGTEPPMPQVKKEWAPPPNWTAAPKPVLKEMLPPKSYGQASQARQTEDQPETTLTEQAAASNSAPEISKTPVLKETDAQTAPQEQKDSVEQAGKTPEQLIKASTTGDTAEQVIKTPEANDTAEQVIKTPEANDTAEQVIKTPEANDTAGQVIKTPEANDTAGQVIKTPEANDTAGQVIKTPEAGDAAEKISPQAAPAWSGKQESQEEAVMGHIAAQPRRSASQDTVLAVASIVPHHEPNAYAEQEEGTQAPLVAGKYRVIREIGKGGMAVVYEALDTLLQRRVAIKRMRDEIRLNKRERDRFLKEARMTARLEHPNIVHIYDIIDEDDILLVFEYIDGLTLDSLLNSVGKLPLTEGMAIARQMLYALDYAHGMGVVHRDLKPSNVMLRMDGVVKVMDFGIARAAKETVTIRTGVVDNSGTCAYMAPEQHLGKADRQSDIFAFGVTVYEMLTGDFPFRGPDFLAQKERMSFTPMRESVEELPETIEAVVAMCLQADKEIRYHTPSEVLATIRAIDTRIPEKH